MNWPISERDQNLPSVVQGGRSAAAQSRPETQAVLPRRRVLRLLAAGAAGLAGVSSVSAAKGGMLSTSVVTATTLGAAAGGTTAFGTAAPSTAAVSTTAPATAEGNRPLRLACSSIVFMSLPIEAACERIAALGFEAIDIWSPHARCPHLDDVATRLGPAGLKALLAKHNLKLFAFSVYAGGYPKYAELLGRAGGGVAVRGSTRPAPVAELVPRMKQFLEELKPELELAEKYNSYLAIENHGGALLHTLDSFKAFVEYNRHPRLGIALAPYHLQALGASVEEAITIAGKQLFFFYAWQRAKGVEQLPGHGPTDFTPWLAALAKVDYRGYVNPFMHGEPPPEEMARALARSCEYLRACHTKLFRS